MFMIKIQGPCCLDVNFAHQLEDVCESKVKDTYRHCKGPSRTIQTSCHTQRYIAVGIGSSQQGVCAKKL